MASSINPTPDDEAKIHNSTAYEPLRSESTIRLLHCKRNLPGSATWELEDYSLSSPKDQPLYTTLSYTWGSSKLSESIDLKTCSNFKITHSVFAVLDAINKQYELSDWECDSWWWIDAICINQDDEKERASQMEYMADIYWKSERTIGWLGWGSGEQGKIEDPDFVARGERAIISLRKLRKHRDAIVDGSESEQRDAMAKLQEHVGERGVAELAELLARPWWRRVWTLQEFLIPEVFEFWCGKECISRGDWKMAVYAIWNIQKMKEYRHMLEDANWWAVWNRRRVLMWQFRWATAFRLPLVALVAYGSESEASEPKDRIFSLLGVAQGAHDKDLIRPSSYTPETPISEIYTDFARSVIEKHNSLDIICFTHTFHQEGSKLPTWVPDWRVKATSFVIPVMASQSTESNKLGNLRPTKYIKLFPHAQPYRASGDRKLRAEFLDHSTILKCECIVVDYIQTQTQTSSTSPAPGNTEKEKDEKGQSPVTPKQASEILDNLAKTLVLGREDRYLSFPYRRGVFYHEFRSLCLLMNSSADALSTSEKLFSTWYQTHQHTHVDPDRNLTLRELVEISPERPEYAKDAYTSERWGDEISFLNRFKEGVRGMAKCLGATRCGRLVMVSSRVRDGDEVCVLSGCSIPVVLRKTQGLDEKGGAVYEVVGEAYMDGFMDGEAVEMAEKGLEGLAFEERSLG